MDSFYSIDIFVIKRNPDLGNSFSSSPDFFILIETLSTAIRGLYDALSYTCAGALLCKKNWRYTCGVYYKIIVCS